MDVWMAAEIRMRRKRDRDGFPEVELNLSSNSPGLNAAEVREFKRIEAQIGKCAWKAPDKPKPTEQAKLEAHWRERFGP